MAANHGTYGGKIIGIAQKLGKLYTQVYSCHDNGDFERIEEVAQQIFTLLGGSPAVAREVGNIVSRMYRSSDDADSFLRGGRRRKHDAIFKQIFSDAFRLDSLIGLKKGSICGEIRWWFYFRMTFSRRTNLIFRAYFFLLTVAYVFRDELSRIHKIRPAILATYYLTGAGISHHHRELHKQTPLLEKYWACRLASVEGDNLIELFMV